MRKGSLRLTRRAFLESSGLFLANVAVAQSVARKRVTIAPTLLQLDSLAPFVDPLPIPKVIQPVRTVSLSDKASSTALPYYRLAMQEFEQRVHRDVKPVRVWGFNGSSPGPTFETRKGSGVMVEWVNQLPTRHLFPIDHSVHGAEVDKPEVRTVVHLHGGKVPPASDGYPEDWYTPGKAAVYHYPNQQDAAALWYHDHALGITRLNVYAGLFGLFLVRDEFEDGLDLPRGKYEIPLMLYDRSFDREAQLFYPVSGDPRSPWVSEVFGDGILVNGKLFPYLEVEPRFYRFRVLNAANGRFFHLAFSSRASFYQIGTDLGLLARPVALESLLLAPGERADVLVDFSAHQGDSLVLTSDSLRIMQFRVGQNVEGEKGSLPSILREVARLPEDSAAKTRILTLGEKDAITGMAEMMLLNNAHWNMPISENPQLNSIEIWSLLNFTDDSHPIHLHGVRFQILDRRSFEPELYYHGGTIHFIGAPVAPSPNEMGWKDTVQAHSGMVTRIIAKFDGYPGRFVWHCHILEHEDNEMMRPYQILES
jgi:spore coat protein A, manganese oxidase